jgi:predicted HD superfamily hydrolase involved in NAD metabolism
MDLVQEIKDVMQEHPKRLSHIMGVMDESMKLAEHYGLDVEKAKKIALLHDIAKKTGDCTMKALMIQGGYDIKEHEKLWHAFVGEYLALTKYGITDEEILNAIKWHPTGHPDMTELQKVLFVADITERNTRMFKDSEIMREISYKSLDEAVAYKLHYMINGSVKMHENTYAMWEQYKKYSKEVDYD